MLHLHLHYAYSCGCRSHCVDTGKEMPRIQCTPNYPIEYLLTLGQSEHSDGRLLLCGTQVAGTQQLHQ